MTASKQRDYVLGMFLDDDLSVRWARLTPQPSRMDQGGAGILLSTGVKHLLVPVPEGESALEHLRAAVAREEKRLSFFTLCDKCGMSTDNRDPEARCFCD